MPGPDSQVIRGFCQNGSGSQVLLGLVPLHKSIMMLVMFEIQVTGQSQVPRYVPHSDKFKTKVCHDQQRWYKNASFLGAGKELSFRSDRKLTYRKIISIDQLEMMFLALNIS